MKLKSVSVSSTVFLFCLFTLVAVYSASAAPFSQFVEFSGALSDTGNFATTHGESPAPFYKNRTTNGLVAGEILAARMGLKAEASNHLVGPIKGTNFAVRDALAGGNGPDDLPAQLKAYLDPRGGKADPNAFFFVFNGGNDVILAVTQPDDKASEKVLNSAVAGLETALRTLVKAGAKTIMAPNFIDVSLVPALRNTPFAGRAHQLSESYNQKFEAMLKHLEHELKVSFIRWDFNAIFKDIIKHGDEFGFTNTTEPCAPLLATGQADPDRYLFLTDTFPTAKVHQIMAEAMALTILQRDAQTDRKHKDDDDDHHGKK